MQALSRREYAKESWFSMHHSYNPTAMSLFVRCYLDESGTHDQSKHAVVAGLLLDRNGFLSLDDEWVKLLPKHRVKAPLHMSKFDDDNRDASLSDGERRDFFKEAVEVINKHKKYSIAAILTQSQYDRVITPTVERMYSQYAFCFMACVYTNHNILTAVKHKDRVPYWVHRGNPRKADIRRAEDSLWQLQDNGEECHFDSVTFKDSELASMQAADMIAWGVRRKLHGLPFGRGFEPISMLYKWHHEQPEWTDKMLQDLLESLADDNEEKLNDDA